MSTIRLNFKDPDKPGYHLDVEADSVKEAVELAMVGRHCLKYVDLHDADLRGLKLRGGNMDYADLSGANLTGAQLTNMNLKMANLSHADLSRADIQRVNMSFVSMCDARITDAYISDTDICKSDLSDADLSGTTLSGVSMSSTYLYQVSFRGSRLLNVHLDHADIQCADFTGADMHNVYFGHTCIQLGCFEGAKIDGRVLWTGKGARPILQLGPCGSVDRQTVVFFFADGSEPLVRCGCFYGTIKEFRKAIHKTHGGTFSEDEYRLLANHIAGMYRLQKKTLRKE